LDTVTLIILSFATYRLGNLLSWEPGPYGILDRLRYFLGVRYDELNKPYAKTEIGRMALCVLCNTVWIALVVVILYYIIGTVFTMVCLPFAISGAAIAINEIVSK
jgi:hypothetical protein